MFQSGYKFKVLIFNFSSISKKRYDFNLFKNAALKEKYLNRISIHFAFKLVRHYLTCQPAMLIRQKFSGDPRRPSAGVSGGSPDILSKSLANPDKIFQKKKKWKKWKKKKGKFKKKFWKKIFFEIFFFHFFSFFSFFFIFFQN